MEDDMAKVVTMPGVNRQKAAALPFAPLLFVKDAAKAPRDFWAVTPSGNYGLDCDAGSTLALQYLEFLAAGRGGWAILQAAVLDMIAKGDRSGVAVGFMGVISRALAASLFAQPGIAAAVRAEDFRMRRHLDSLPGSGDGISSLR
jgi:hypothetical protein